MKAENAAALAAMEAVWQPAQIHEVGKVPTSPVTPYATVSVDAGTPDNYSLAAEHGSKSYRISVQCFGKSDGEISFPFEAANEAFLDKRLAISGYDTTPCEQQVSTPVIRDPDGGGLLSCFLTYVFTATPLA